MTNDQLMEYFAGNEKKENLLPIPSGFPVFILCIIQGKLSPVRVMINSGANFQNERTTNVLGLQTMKFSEN